MPTRQTFELKREHLLLLRELEWMPGDYGTPETDQKRPFGNSGRYAIARDIADILQWNMKEPYEERAMQLFEELPTALKVILESCEVEPGTYIRIHREVRWHKEQ